MSDATDLKAEVLTLRMENKELRNAYNTFMRRVDELCMENEQLRELVRIAIEYCVNGYCAEEDECPLYESRTSCKLYAKACELGIEVD